MSITSPFLLMSRICPVSSSLFYCIFAILRSCFVSSLESIYLFFSFLAFGRIRSQTEYLRANMKKRTTKWLNLCILMHDVSSNIWMVVKNGVDRLKQKWIRSSYEDFKAVSVEAREVRTKMEQLWHFGHNSLNMNSD